MKQKSRAGDNDLRVTSDTFYTFSFDPFLMRRMWNRVEHQESSLLPSSLHTPSILFLQVLVWPWLPNWACRCCYYWPLPRYRCWPRGDARRRRPPMSGTTGMAVSTQIILCLLWAKGEVQGSSWWCQRERWKMTLRPRCLFVFMWSLTDPTEI